MYEVYEWRHAAAVLRYEFPAEFEDVLGLLNTFRLTRTDILTKGGRKSPMAIKLDSYLYEREWIEKDFDTKIVVDGVVNETPTHKVDCYRNRVALEVEWNNKTEFYDRDLNNFRLLHDREVISLGIIVTRATELQTIFKRLGKGSSYGASTTHMDKLVPKIDGGSAGGCPVLVFGIKAALYVEE
ncbi:Restriction endonuclease BglII [Neolewinella agarilytica]|uniref:Restriction endonuclease BglII n=2 Tax=Neolewinella agarilytica TaxID=478744 RepID=A0A1H9LZN7_9BACT|nr:Restriction endonuclease BglII [Neolewinella agarilytica]